MHRLTSQGPELVVFTVTLQQKCPWFESWLGSFSVEIACSPCVCVGLPWVLGAGLISCGGVVFLDVAELS